MCFRVQQTGLAVVEDDACNSMNMMDSLAAAAPTPSTLRLQMSTEPRITEPTHELTAPTRRVAQGLLDYYPLAREDQQVRQDPQVCCRYNAVDAILRSLCRLHVWMLGGFPHAVN